MQTTEIDFSKVSDEAIVKFIVADLSRFHENQAEAAKTKAELLANLSDGAYFVRSRHGFALVLPVTAGRNYAILNYLFSCVRGHGALLIGRVKEACREARFVVLRCYTDELRDYYLKHGFTLHSSDGGYTMDWWPERQP